MSSGWVGPGARTAPQNKQDLDNYNLIKARVEADEKEKRDVDNARRISTGQKPLEDSVWTKMKKVIGKSRLLD